MKTQLCVDNSYPQDAYVKYKFLNDSFQIEQTSGSAKNGLLFFAKTHHQYFSQAPFILTWLK